MSDPFSVAGTAVGITSLGIQVCQGLFQYYTKFRGIHSDIDDVLERIEGLERLLRSLNSLKPECDQAGDSEVSSHLNMSLRACEETVQRLKWMALRYGETNDPSSFEEHLRLAKKRLSWPFRRDTLMELRDTLSGLQDNLALSHQILAHQDSSRKLETIQGTADTLVTHTGLMENYLRQNSMTLQIVRDDIQNISTGQQEQAMVKSVEYSNLRAQLDLRSMTVERKLDQLISSVLSADRISQATPRLITQLVEPPDHSQPQSRNMSRMQNTASQSIANTMKFRPSRCKSKVFRILVFREEVNVHHKGCPYYTHADFSTATGIQFLMKLHRVRVGWQVSRYGGEYWIQPMLRYRAVVPSNAPAFKILSDGIDLIHMRYLYQDKPQEELTTLLNKVFLSLRQCLCTSESPLDVTVRGEGIMTVCFTLSISIN
ncbi:hypothetical protein GQ44DRAFT_603580 [Phaeosphaeriaceae sp. PMI808]|nr:hypothetical protein GQ44DRAFT_603580 [Phaeosphaeriaceae sp. PMI808]